MKSDVDRNKLVMNRCKLRVVNGKLAGREFVIDKAVYTIGSGPNNRLELDDSTVSRHHCEIHTGARGYAVRDLGSTNGTRINGTAVSEAVIEPGAELVLGQTRLLFCAAGETVEYALSGQESFGAVIGRSVAMRRLFHLAQKYAATDTTVLIEGETGTGKEILAEELHRHSDRRDRPFVVIDCAALSQELVASELFGHKKGAFTGALADRIGAFEHAHGGTVFLDEIGDLGAELQPKLLRVLEKKEIRRVGSNEVVPVDVRIISATNKRLEIEVNRGGFREDLFYRLSVVHLTLPPLRERKEDLGPLVERFVRQILRVDDVHGVVDLDRAAAALARHNWPGNVRELRNLVELAAYGDSRPLDFEGYLQIGRRRSEAPPPDVTALFAANRAFKEAKGELIRRFEIGYVTDLLRQTGGNVSEAARVAGIERVYLQRLMRKYGMKAD